MTRRLALACGFFLLSWGEAGLTSTARAQLPFTRDLLPSRTALGRVGLERAWYALVPLGNVQERVISINIDGDMMFAQTNFSNFFAFDAESGKLLWRNNLGRVTGRVVPACVNSDTVFGSNTLDITAMDKRSGVKKWSKELDVSAASSTAFGSIGTNSATSPISANEERVCVGLNSGKLVSFNLKDLRTAAHPLAQAPGSFGWAVQTGKPIVSRPIPVNLVLAFAGLDGRVYVSENKPRSMIFRWRAGGPINADMGEYSTRTLIVASQDYNVYALDLYDGELAWTFPTGSPVEQPPLVSGEDVYVVNNKGSLSNLDAKGGQARWTKDLDTRATLLALGEKRLYLRTADRDLIVVDRAAGKILFDAAGTFDRAGVRLREFTLGPPNMVDDRMYLASPSGFIICLREMGRLKPLLLRDPKAEPFGFIPDVKGAGDAAEDKSATPEKEKKDKEAEADKEEKELQ